jgi:hypothetical protein
MRRFFGLDSSPRASSRPTPFLLQLISKHEFNNSHPDKSRSEQTTPSPNTPSTSSPDSPDGQWATVGTVTNNFSGATPSVYTASSTTACWGSPAPVGPLELHAVQQIKCGQTSPAANASSISSPVRNYWAPVNTVTNQDDVREVSNRISTDLPTLSHSTIAHG